MRLTRLAAVAGASVALVLAGGAVAPSAAFADSYPTWEDVRKAKAGQAATQREVQRVTTLLTNLTVQAKQAQTTATDAGATLQHAQQAFFSADQKYAALESVADDANAAADVAGMRAGRLAAQLYRTGGHNMSIGLLLSTGQTSSKGQPAAKQQAPTKQQGPTKQPATKQQPAPKLQAGTDDSTMLLDQLGSMTKLTESSSQLWAKAQQAKNTSAAASAQAKSALDERTRLQQRAEAALDAASQAATSAQDAVTAEHEHSDELHAMLAALKDKTAKTVTAYEDGVRVRAEEARRRQAAAERAAAQRARESQATQPAASGWVVPVRGTITAGFGPRPAPCAGCSTWHEGVDIAAASGTAIRAAHSGTVVYVGWYGGYGNFILVDHGGAISTAYGHNINGGIVVSIGQHVSAGQVIGHVGSTGHSTGAHLHFEVRQNGVQTNPILWMSQHGAAL